MMDVQVRRVMFPLMLSLFLGASSIIWPLAPAAAFQLPSCQLINQMVSLEKEGCPKCHPVETTICSGHCITKDPVFRIPFSKVYQDVCTYQDMYYKTFELPDCLPGVNPTVTYPVALSCHCGRCATDTSDCTHESLQPNFCIDDIPFYY
ncbi:lutropin subunit beta [Anoplopoma fimbria]|uniref:Gonadotropin subunit beta-2 n=1 Tax=Anoplopoma fimbria TaxID=229290 RepID=S5TRX0_ANOFI|nr:lutropin subunit beta [Anoplopoma fimbria]AGS55584.1 luteinizing hormone beta subunit [Anoplopoma fimbria]